MAPKQSSTHLFPSRLELPTISRMFTVPQSALFCAVFNVEQPLLQLSCPEPWGQAGQESPSSFCK